MHLGKKQHKRRLMLLQVLRTKTKILETSKSAIKYKTKQTKDPQISIIPVVLPQIKSTRNLT